jgi:D-glycero-D-manno-heptose 1,7-bisphosphate phosphatase
MTGRSRAVFLDRDGTLVEDEHYLADASATRLVAGAAEAVRRLNGAGVLVVVVTNQSGIAQGLITPAQYELTRARLDALLADAGAHLAGTYHCPHHPSISGPCNCRKPGTALFLQAAREFDIDLTRSLFAGDRFRDIEPGLTLGGRAMLIPSRETPPEDLDRAKAEAAVAPDLASAVETFLALPAA